MSKIRMLKYFSFTENPSNDPIFYVQHIHGGCLALVQLKWNACGGKERLCIKILEFNAKWVDIYRVTLVAWHYFLWTSF